MMTDYVMTDYDGLPPSRSDAVNVQSVALEAATIRQQHKVLRKPTIAAQCAQPAEQAVRERRTHLPTPNSTGSDAQKRKGKAPRSRLDTALPLASL
jgi:hypothetical protein